MPIKVNYAQMEAAREQMQAISGQIDEKLDALRSKLQQIQWEGADQQAYQAHQAQWDTAVREINQLLNEIGGGVGIARENYVNTESSNTRLWS
jgi:early secretory antigenic target protein ESAT-6